LLEFSDNTFLPILSKILILIHVIGVEMDFYIRLINHLHELDALITGIDEKGFITVNGFDTDVIPKSAANLATSFRASADHFQ